MPTPFRNVSVGPGTIIFLKSRDGMASSGLKDGGWKGSAFSSALCSPVHLLSDVHKNPTSPSQSQFAPLPQAFFFRRPRALPKLGAFLPLLPPPLLASGRSLGAWLGKGGVVIRGKKKLRNNVIGLLPTSAKPSFPPTITAPSHARRIPFFRVISCRFLLKRPAESILLRGPRVSMMWA